MRGTNMEQVVVCLVLLFVGNIFATEPQNPVEDKSAEEDDPLLHTLHNVLISKMSEARNTVLHGSPAGHILVMDPFKMEPLSLTVQEPKGFVNVSLRKMSVEGLGNFQLRDIVTNLDILRTSSLSDEGLFEARIPNGMASWIGRIDLKDTEHSGDSILSLSQAAFRTYWEAASHAFLQLPEEEQRRPGERRGAAAGGERRGHREGQKMAEEGLEQAIAHVMGRSKQTSWFEMYPLRPNLPTTSVIDPDFELLEEDTSPFISISDEPRPHKEEEPASEGRSRRRASTFPQYNREDRRHADNLFVQRGRQGCFEHCQEEERIRQMHEFKHDLRSRGAIGESEGEPEIQGAARLSSAPLQRRWGCPNQGRLKIWKLGHVTVRLRGLGNLTSALSMLLTHQINEGPQGRHPGGRGPGDARHSPAAQQHHHPHLLPHLEIISLTILISIFFIHSVHPLKVMRRKEKSVSSRYLPAKIATFSHKPLAGVWNTTGNFSLAFYLSRVKDTSDTMKQFLAILACAVVLLATE
ncbi:uncharacterized protein CEXT_525481 [Caerostris extrusa]|uniref:Uncharacterized protein n=1 Tax=Caerostris extrusa TaxID=172846 RepID=A0AAV4MPI0_CAEEX|nr:uncharacterized protein CEXT_525481 [Caerostris extrusa]